MSMDEETKDKIRKKVYDTIATQTLKSGTGMPYRNWKEYRAHDTTLKSHLIECAVTLTLKEVEKAKKADKVFE